MNEKEAMQLIGNMGFYIDTLEIKNTGMIKNSEFSADSELFTHKCFIIGGVGSNGIVFVIDSVNGKVYESLGKGEDGKRKLVLKK
ncbi:hypothetical protein H1057_18155 [Clostridium sporogenes]|uniref:hypothetical protein n=1 Tax=Clostridium sporogenes TaxID=1509 RepID=UPI0015EEFF2E|nr:hypothetical protein [Clostridium sporogenes]MBA4509943.1 hypothetical protein [Clostridium sporogenes]